MTDHRVHRDREYEEDVEILEALVGRSDEGMTVLELRAAVDADIDTIEARLPELKREGLIVVEQQDNAAVIRPDESVVPDTDKAPDDDSVFEKLDTVIDKIRERIRL